MAFQKGNKIGLGRVHSTETRRKIGLRHMRSMSFVCRCGTEITRRPSEITKRKFCSNECAKKHLKGKNHYNWQGGLSTLREKIKHSLSYRSWRLNIFRRDNFKCVMCEATKKLNADHHPISFAALLRIYEISSLEKALSCEALWKAEGRTLCESCHEKTPTYGYKNIAKLKLVDFIMGMFEGNETVDLELSTGRL